MYIVQYGRNFRGAGFPTWSLDVLETRAVVQCCMYVCMYVYLFVTNKLVSHTGCPTYDKYSELAQSRECFGT